MISVKVMSPVVDDGLVVNWKGGKVVPVLSNRDEREEWNYILSQGLYGKYGHLVNLEDCLFLDFVIALSVLFGRENCLVSPDGEKQLEKEKEEERQNPIPKGATS